jgi:hypothetical protein
MPGRSEPWWRSRSTKGRSAAGSTFRQPSKPFDLIADLALDAPVKRARDARLEREHDPRPG